MQRARLVVPLALVGLVLGGCRAGPSDPHSLPRGTDLPSFLVQSPDARGTLLLGTRQGVFRSSDAGATWRRAQRASFGALSAGFTPGSTIVTRGRLFQRGNLGYDRVNAPQRAPFGRGSAVSLAWLGGGKLYALVTGGRSRLYVTVNSARSWFGRPAFALPGETRQIAAVRVDGHADVLFAAAGSAGLWRSLDAGVTWRPPAGGRVVVQRRDHGAGAARARALGRPAGALVRRLRHHVAQDRLLRAAAGQRSAQRRRLLRRRHRRPAARLERRRADVVAGPDRHVVAFGGGGLAAPLVRHVLGLARRTRPRVLFVPTASGDPDAYVARFYEAFTREDCRPAWLPLFLRTGEPLRPLLLEHDVVFVGGGNTANLLAIWRVHGLDEILREAWEAGVVLCGSSAGALCWFEAGVSDSFGPQLAGLHDGLGLLPGSMCPHYDSEPLRRPVYTRLVRDEGFPSGLAAEDGVGLHFRGRELHEVVSERPEGRAFRVTAEGETPLPVRRLAP